MHFFHLHVIELTTCDSAKMSCYAIPSKVLGRGLCRHWSTVIEAWENQFRHSTVNFSGAKNFIFSPFLRS